MSFGRKRFTARPVYCCRNGKIVLSCGFMGQLLFSNFRKCDMCIPPEGGSRRWQYLRYFKPCAMVLCCCCVLYLFSNSSVIRKIMDFGMQRFLGDNGKKLSGSYTLPRNKSVTDFLNGKPLGDPAYEYLAIFDGVALQEKKTQ